MNHRALAYSLRISRHEGMRLGSTKFFCLYHYDTHIHPVYTPMVIAYAVQLSWHPKAIEVKPFLQTVSAESTGPHAEDRPKPVTGIKKREYEIGNECVPREPDIPCRK